MRGRCIIAAGRKGWAFRGWNAGYGRLMVERDPLPQARPLAAASRPSWRNLLLGWILAVAAIALFCALGAWQFGRMQAKRDMLEQVGSVLEARLPQPLALAADPARARDYDWAAGTGTFADLPAVLLDNQQRDGRVGVRAYRLFLPVRGRPLLVELGWLPLPPDRRLPQVPRPPGQRRIEGLLLPPPSGGLASRALLPQPSGALLATAIDRDRLAAAFRLPAVAPRVLRLDPRQPLGYARDLDVLPNTLPPERHLGYAVQWFGLALAVLATALVLTFRRPGSTKSGSTKSGSSRPGSPEARP